MLHKCAIRYNSLTARSEPLPSPWVFHRLFNKSCGFLKRFPGDTALRTLTIRSRLKILTFRIDDKPEDLEGHLSVAGTNVAPLIPWWLPVAQRISTGIESLVRRSPGERIAMRSITFRSSRASL